MSLSRHTERGMSGCDPGPERQVVIGQDAAELADPLAAGERCRVADHRGGKPEAPGPPLLVLVRPPL